jgi:FkbM family methyltransferase
MGLKYQIGSFAGGVVERALRSRTLPLTRYFPRGYSWMYDAQRFAGQRRFETIFDVGANVGQTANALLRFFPDAKIYCFEPIGASFKVLEANYGTRTVCMQMALGATPGTMDVKLRSDSELNSLRADFDRPGYYAGGTETVKISTADLFCAERGVRTIDILKMDVQGWEIEVLRGASGLLGSNRIRYVYAEVGFRRNDVEMVMFGDLDEEMAKHGFLFSGFYDAYRYGPSKEFMLFANVLYTNPNFTAGP